MKQIHKYVVRIPEESHLPLELELPEDHEIVHVADPAERGEALAFWALVDPESEFITRELMAIPTGEPVDDEHYYMATVRTRGGRIVIHVFGHVDDLPHMPELEMLGQPEEEQEEDKEEEPVKEEPKPQGKGKGGSKKS
jgi:hypothetical protein